jgi:quercetin dioxygenase-like cupin family protein
MSDACGANRPAMSEPIDLHTIGAELLASITDDHDGGRAAKTVMHEPGLRATLIALRAGQELAEHDAPPAASLLVVAGDVQLRTSSYTTSLTGGQLTAIPHERHSLLADTDAIVLLTVRFD